ncbi:MAG: GumC family protein [Xenococcus sp. (in: cyanobacteria)]
MNSDYNNASQLFPNKSNETFSSMSQINSATENNNEETFNLEWLFAVFIRRLPIMIGVAILLTACIGYLLIKESKQTIPIYQGNFRLLIEPASVEGRFTQQFIRAQSSGVDVNKIRIEDSGLVDYETQIRVLKSQEIIKGILNEIQTNYPGMNYDSLNSRLKINRITYNKNSKAFGTKIIQVSYTDKDAKRIQFVLEKVANYYLDYSLQERLTNLNYAIDFLEEQVPTIERQVNQLQNEFQSFRKESKLFDPQRQTLQLSAQIKNLEEQKTLAEVELIEEQEKYAKLQEQYAQGNFISILSDNYEGYGRLLSEALKLQSKVAIESARLREDSLPMQGLREQERKINLLLSQETSKVLERIAIQINILQAKNQKLAQKTAELNEQINNLPSLLRQYNEFERQLELATDFLDESSSKLKALKLDAGQQKIPWQLIAQPKVISDRAGNPIPTEASSTKRQLVIVGVLSILLGVGCGFLVEVIIPVFHTPEEVTAATKVPLLGVIPVAKQLKKNSINQNKNTPVATLAGVTANKSNTFLADNSYQIKMEYSPKLLEAFRSFYTNIRLLTYESALKSLVISSAVHGEGKSTIAINLARIAASVGQRVLLVDANLRNPQIHLRLGLPNVQGFSDTISTDISLNDAIQRSPEDENLFILTAGQVPPDPIKLLSSQKRKYLMEQFNAFFDLIIYDTPPLVDLADTSLITAHVDGTILVVRIEKTDRSMLTKAIEGLKISGASVLGIVTNFHKR